MSALSRRALWPRTPQRAVSERALLLDDDGGVLTADVPRVSGSESRCVVVVDVQCEGARPMDAAV